MANNDYFHRCKTCEDLKREYHKLARRLHPDCGGDQAAFIAMQAAFDAAFSRLRNIHTTASGDTYERETTETAGEFRSIIDALLALRGLEVELCGSWVWIGGDTRAHASDLKELHCRWSASKRKWYYTHDMPTRKRRGAYSMDKIRQVYGSQRYTVARPQLDAD